jgi:hypothetical protein
MGWVNVDEFCGQLTFKITFCYPHFQPIHDEPPKSFVRAIFGIDFEYMNSESKSIMAFL